VSPPGDADFDPHGDPEDVSPCECDWGEHCPICDPGFIDQSVQCPRCDGTGEIDPGDGREEAECPECDGEGRVEW
jgi:DnaJ-class molecular chaperone